jgi:hypothetical protein
MHWFHEVADMRWLAVFWVASFLMLFGLFVLMTLGGKPRRPRRLRGGSTPRPYEPHAPRPSI